MMYSIYVGHYDSPAVSKSDVAKLNRMGLTGFIFSRGDYYAIKVFSSPNQQLITEWKKNLEKIGFSVEVEAIDLKKSLHLN